MSLLEKKQYFINKKKNVSTLKSLKSNSGDLTVVRINRNQNVKRKPKEKKNQINQKSYAAIMKIKKF